MGRSPEPGDWYDIGRTVVLVFAAIGAVPAGYIAYRRQQTLETQNAFESAKEDNRRDELRHADRRADTAALRSRFTEASAQLGSDQAAVRLAGVYSMADLADDWAEFGDARARQQCVDVLCAYLRMPFPFLNPGWDHREPDPAEVQVRETLVRVINAHLRGTTPRWEDVDLDFNGAQFPAGFYDFSGTNFCGRPVSFVGARFEGARIVFVGAQVATRLSFDRSVGSAGEVDFSFAWIKPSARIDFTDSAFSGSFRLILNALHMTGGVVMGGPGIAENAAVHLNTMKALAGGRIIFKGMSCMGNGKLILSDVELGSASIELPDRTLTGGVFNGSYDAQGAEGFPAGPEDNQDLA